MLVVILQFKTYAPKPMVISGSSNNVDFPTCQNSLTSQVELGYPNVNVQPAEFTTDGSQLFITARHYDHGGFGGSLPGSTVIYVGDSAALPTYDHQRSTVSNLLKKISVDEHKYGFLTLPAGRYWLWSSSGGDVIVVSCSPNGITDPIPVK